MKQRMKSLHEIPLFYSYILSLTMIFVRISATVVVQADQPATIPQVLDHHHHPEPMMMTTDLPSAPPLELEESDLDFRFLVFTVYKIGLQHTILFLLNL